MNENAQIRGPTSPGRSMGERGVTSKSFERERGRSNYGCQWMPTRKEFRNLERRKSLRSFNNSTFEGDGYAAAKATMSSEVEPSSREVMAY